MEEPSARDGSLLIAWSPALIGRSAVEQLDEADNHRIQPDAAAQRDRALHETAQIPHVALLGFDRWRQSKSKEKRKVKESFARNVELDMLFICTTTYLKRARARHPFACWPISWFAMISSARTMPE
jgi:hypothetical protein